MNPSTQRQKCIIQGCNKHRWSVCIDDEETGEQIRDYSKYCYEHMRLSKKPIIKELP